MKIIFILLSTALIAFAALSSCHYCCCCTSKTYGNVTVYVKGTDTISVVPDSVAYYESQGYAATEVSRLLYYSDHSICGLKEVKAAKDAGEECVLDKEECH